jgi:Fe-S cluster assembly protein SufB
MTTIARPELEGLERYKFGWADSDVAGESARRGLSEEVVRDISTLKDEPGRAWSGSTGTSAPRSP